MLWVEADELVQEIIAHMQGCPAVEKIEAAGSYRRGTETVGDLDFLVVSRRSRRGDGSAGGLRAAWRRSSPGARPKRAAADGAACRSICAAVPAESFGAALQYFTGSKAHNIVLRGLAKERGLKINEYGVFRGEKRIAGRTEEEVYAALDLPCFPPEMREARREFDWADAGQLPTLIELGDICGDLHTHSTWTDGQATIEEMATAAKSRGLKYIAITDHSKRVTMVGGLKPDQLLEQWAEIDKLNKRLRGITVLKGVEVDILERGGLDIPDEVLAEADWVVASVHFGQQQPREQITGRVLDALHNPHVDAIAHPTGRMLLERKPYEIDMEAVMRAAREQRQGAGAERPSDAARSGRRGLHGGEEPRHSDGDFHRRPSPGGARRDALRHPAGPPRRPDEGRRAQYPHLAADEEDAGKAIAVGCAVGWGRHSCLPRAKRFSADRNVCPTVVTTPSARTESCRPGVCGRRRYRPSSRGRSS